MLCALAALCRPAAADGTTAAPFELPPLEALFDAALHHDVMGLVANALLSGRGGALSEETREGLAIYLEGVRIDVLRAEVQLAGLLRRFDRSGLAVMPFKGPLLAHSAYADRGLRASRDLDLMVRLEDIDAAVGCLEAAGFTHEPGLDRDGLAALRRYAGEYIMFRRDSLPVEPHWFPAPRTMAFDIDMASIWRRARPACFLDAPCQLPTLEDHCFLLALHGAKEQWHKLKWLADIAAVQAANPALDLQALRSFAAAQGCRRVVDLALLLSHRLFAVPAEAPPADATTAQIANGVLDRLARTAEPPDGPYVVTRFHWRLRERPRDRWRYAVRTLFTPRVAHYRRLPLPRALRWVHVPLKLPWDHLLTPAIGLGRRLRSRQP
jgi:hypothetical protein